MEMDLQLVQRFPTNGQEEMLEQQFQIALHLFLPLTKREPIYLPYPTLQMAVALSMKWRCQSIQLALH